MKFEKNIIFTKISDESDFHLGDYVNEHCRVSGTVNMNVFIVKPMHPQRVTVWCAFCFENEEGGNVTVNGKRYCEMLTDCFFHEM